MSESTWSDDVTLCPRCPKCGADVTVYEGEDVCTECTGFAPVGPKPPRGRKRSRTARQQRHADLARRAKAGDGGALNELVKDVTRFVYRLAHRYADLYRVDADDLAQDGMLKVLGAVRTWRADGGASFLTYAGAAAREMCRQGNRWARRRAVSLRALAEEPAARGSQQEEARAAVEEALSGLGAVTRQLVEAGAGGKRGGLARTGRAHGLSAYGARDVHTSAVARLRQQLSGVL